MARAREILPPPTGSIIRMRFGAIDVYATVVEDRGRLGIGGRHLLLVRFYRPGTTEPIETEVPADEAVLVALPNEAIKRIGVEASGQSWIGTYTSPDGRVAVVTEEAATQERARAAAERWIRSGLEESDPNGSRGGTYQWRPDPAYPGRYAVYKTRSFDGYELVREAP